MALFVGREREVAQLRAALEAGPVCLVGPRGVGLSRLAEAAAPAVLIERGAPAPPEAALGPGCLIVGRRLPGIPAVEVGPLGPAGAGRLLREAANLHSLGAGDALTDAEVSALVSHLDGLPGAILSAAAQLPILGAAQLQRVAADGLWFDRDRDAAALAGLDAEARALLEGIAVFSEAFCALDAVAVGLGPARRVLSGLLGLQRAGLLVAEDDGGGGRTLRLLRRTRAALPERVPSAAFAGWLSERAAAWVAAMDGAAPRQARLALRRHRADLEAVVASGEGERATLLGALSVHFDCEGPVSRVRPLLDAALAACGPGTPQGIRHGLLLRHEVSCRLSGDAATAVSSAERAVAEAAGEAQRADAELHLARACRLLGQPGRVQEILAAQRARLPSPGLRVRAGWARMEATAAYDRRELLRCRALTLEGLALSHRAQWPAERARLAFNLYILRGELGHGAENAGLRDEVLGDLEDTGQRWLADTIRVLAPHEQRRAGALSAAEASLRRARVLAGADPIHGLLVVLEEGWLALARGRPAAAAGSAELAGQLVTRLPAPQYAAQAAQLRQAASAGATAAVQIQRDGRGFTVPGVGAVDLSRRGPAARIVAHLLEHIDAGAVPSAELVSVGWPGQVLIGGSGATRLHTVVRWLRKAGLAEVLITQEGGYRLDPARVQAV